MRFNFHTQRLTAFSLQFFIMAIYFQVIKQTQSTQTAAATFETSSNSNQNYFDFINKVSKNAPNEPFLAYSTYSTHLATNSPYTTQHKSRSKRQGDDNLRIFGLRVENSPHEVKLTSNNVPTVMLDESFQLRIFGTGITSNTVLALTKKPAAFGQACIQSVQVLYKPVENTAQSALYSIAGLHLKGIYYVCSKNDEKLGEGNANEVRPLVHMGDASYLQLDTYERLLPLWAIIILIIVLMMLSALFSGLNLGLMTLDRNELKLLCNTGTPKERHYARTIWPVRIRGNYLLCAVLLGNVLVNSTLTILLEMVSTGVIAVICSTLIIVIFGEIIPQAVCTRYGLLIGAKTIYLTKTVMVLTAPLSYPISKVLDLIMGEEIGNIYTRDRLRELLLIANEDGKNMFDQTEVNIISGALEMHKKTVGDIMTLLDDCYLLSIETTLNFETISDIMRAGYSRIPVYEGERTNIVTLMYIKDLAFVDADDNMPLRALCDFYNNKVLFVDENEHLNVIFDKFRSGQHGHLAVVQRRTVGDTETDIETVTVGLVTLEDVIEELIQEEIIDETDVLQDNRSKKARLSPKHRDFANFVKKPKQERLTSQMAMAAYQFLSTSVAPFLPPMMVDNVLHRLLEYDIVYQIKVTDMERHDERRFIYQAGKPADYFVLLLEGHVLVEIGTEKLHFESGPFTYFGTQALDNVLPNDNEQDDKPRQVFVPDYTVRAITNVLYIGITRQLYKTARNASALITNRRSVAFNDELVSTFFGKPDQK